MNKEKLKKILSVSLIIFLGLAASIAFFFLIYQKDNIGEKISQIVSILRPLTIGAILAYIMKGTCNIYEKFFFNKLSQSGKRSEKSCKKASNVIAVILTYFTWTAAITALLYIAIPQIYESVSKFANDLINNIPTYVDIISKWGNDFLEDNPSLEPYVLSVMNMVTEWVNTELLPSLKDIGLDVLNRLLSLVTVVKDIAMGLVFSVFFLIGRKVFGRKSKLLLYSVFKEKTADVIVDEFKYADKMFGGFLEGKVIDSVLIGLIYYVALEIMNIPYPALIAVICGITNIIPFFGPFIGAAPSALIILMSTEHPIQVIYFIIFVCVIQFVDGNIIDPHIVGGNIKMSPFCVIFAVTLFGGLWGFMGLLIGVPTFAVIYDIFKKIATYLLARKGKEHLINEYLSEFTPEPKDPKRKKSKFSAIKNAVVKPSENYDDSISFTMPVPKEKSEIVKVDKTDDTNSSDKTE